MITKTNFLVPIFNVKVYVVVYDTLKEAQEKFPTFMEDGIDACVIENTAKKLKMIIPAISHRVAVHELEHAKNIIWKYIGYETQTKNDEVDAYLLDYLYDKIDKIIKRHLALRD